jgi:predicted DCC family thiol-disulfide oxidoreductase YuxK
MNERRVLLYRGTCGKCRTLSRVIVLASLGRVRRVPIGSPEAEALYTRDPAARNRLALAHGAAIQTGRAMTANLAGVVVMNGVAVGGCVALGVLMWLR